MTHTDAEWLRAGAKVGGAGYTDAEWLRAGAKVGGAG